MSNIEHVTNPLALDLDHILEHTERLWDELRGQRIFITGGTGFFGCWLLESFIWANDRLQLGAEAVVLTRDPGALRRKAPHLAGHASIDLHLGDVRTCSLPQGHFSHIIHAASYDGPTAAKQDWLLMFDTIVRGTEHILELAHRCGARKFLLTSSGAVYGKQPPEISHLTEDFAGAPRALDPRSTYGEGKRAAEMLCALYHGAYGIETKIARCFAFVGPYLPVDRHFAIGNFIRDALCGGPIRVEGDGTPYRSYLYAADLAIWLWTILFRGPSCRTFNVGGEDEVSIADLARSVSAVMRHPVDVRILTQPDPGRTPERYVPSTQRAQKELGLRQTIDLRQSIERTVGWHQSREKYGPPNPFKSVVSYVG